MAEKHFKRGKHVFFSSIKEEHKLQRAKQKSGKIMDYLFLFCLFWAQTASLQHVGVIRMDDFRLHDIYMLLVLSAPKTSNRQFSKVVKYSFESAERDFPTLNLHACQRIDSLKLAVNAEEKPKQTQLEKDEKRFFICFFFFSLISGNSPGPKINLCQG